MVLDWSYDIDRVGPENAFVGLEKSVLKKLQDWTINAELEVFGLKFVLL